jgi:predicted N-acetyltransferase YhbS
MRRCIETARAQGHALVLLVGDEPYYSRFGFRRVPDRQLELPGPVNPERFLGLDLDPGALERSRGAVIPRKVI